MKYGKLAIPYTEIIEPIKDSGEVAIHGSLCGFYGTFTLHIKPGQEADAWQILRNRLESEDQD